jgi:hypothetical protein
MTPIFTATVRGGKLVQADLNAVKRHLATLDGHDVEFTIKRKRSQRSLDQNKFWWAVPVAILAEHCGYTPSQMHYALLGECFGYLAGPTGQPVPNVPSSSELSVDEFSRLIEWVLTWAPSELGVSIPAPNEVDA